MHKLSVIIPYRNRSAHLKKLLPTLVKIFISQNIDAEIIVVEQDDDLLFNRARLLNIGYLNSRIDSDYFCFHDVDLIPLEANYTYPENPTHLSEYCSQFNFKIPYDNLMGGVVLINRQDFEKINGFSNFFET